MHPLKSFPIILLITQLTQGKVLFQDSFDADGLEVNQGTGGSLLSNSIRTGVWADDGNATFTSGGTNFRNRALLYSSQSFQSDTGFKATFYYKTGSVDDTAGHNFSFGLISADTDLSTYEEYNPFKTTSSIYSVGLNLTSDVDITARGLNFANGTSNVTLDQSGTNAEFIAGEVTKVTFEIGEGGYWSYRINDVYEASGVTLDGFDLSKNYHLAVYAQDDNGDGKTIEAMQLETRYAQGERAANVRSTWASGIPVSFLDDISHLKTLDSLSIGFTSGASQSAVHFAPHKLLESLAEGNLFNGEPMVPLWGDLNLNRPENDVTLQNAQKIKAAGFKVKAYINCENFVGNNGDGVLFDFAERWFAHCDSDPEIQAFINSQPFHTGIWNRDTQEYEVAYNDDGSERYPYRKYMFCYAEYVLKDYAMRYGYLIDNWIFDDGGTMEDMGDNATSGLIEEQRIYQAYANAVHAGNPEIPLAFNNGRSTIRYFAYPYAHAVRFEDFTFGHAFGGNNDHASKTGSQFNNNYRHITRMNADADGVELNGNVFAGDEQTWDDQIVGHFHSKLSTTAWKYGSNQAWEQDDFNQWNLEAMQAGGAITWDGSFNRGETSLYGWVVPLLTGMDDHLSEFESPGAPNWARAYTVLPEAYIGEPYYHELIEGRDFWDPEGDDIIVVWFYGNVPSWLSIQEDPDNEGTWVITGTPDEREATGYTFNARARDEHINNGTRSIDLTVLDPVSNGLVAEWKFEEQSGTTVADSASGKHLATDATGARTEGLHGNAILFSGPSSSVTLPASAFEEARLTEELTISMWTFGDPFLSNRVTALNAVDNQGEPALNIHLPWTDGNVIWDAGNTGDSFDRIIHNAEPSSYSGAWNHWIFTKNANTGEMSIYLNGELFHTESDKTIQLDQITTIALGNNVAGDSGFYGMIDEVRIYSVALNSYGANELYHSYDAFGYDRWVQDFNIDPTNDTELDPDSDGIPNIMEYVLNSDPENANQSVLPKIQREGNDFVFNFTRRSESAFDTEQYFLYSTDLITWTKMSLTDANLHPAINTQSFNNGTDEVKISLLSSTLEEEGKLFGKLEVYPLESE